MNKTVIYLSFAITMAIPQFLNAQNVGIGTTTPTTTLEVISQKKLGVKVGTDSAMGATTVNADFINFPAGIKGAFNATGNNDGSGVLGTATSTNQYYGVGVTGVGNWIGVLGIGNPNAEAAIVAEANGAAFGLKVVGNSFFNNNVNVSGEAVIGSNVLLGGGLYAEDVYTSYNVEASGNVTVGGTITIEGGSPGAGKVLTSTGTTGAATWQTPTTVAPTGFMAAKYNGDVTIPQFGSWNKLTFSPASFTQGTSYSNVNSEFTVPASGLYHLNVKLLMENFSGTSANTGPVSIAIYRRTIANPTGGAAYEHRFMPVVASSSTEGFAVSIPLVTGDIIDIRVYNQSNGTIVVKGPSQSGMLTHVSCYRIY